MICSPKSDLLLRVATPGEVAHACRTWHYSRTIPAGKLLAVAVIESGEFIGVIHFANGGSRHLGAAYGLDRSEVAVLSRVALTSHQAPVTRMVRIALTLLRRAHPRIKLVISYADQLRRHHGGVYQGGNWLYHGETAREHVYLCPDGRWRQRRTTSSLFGSTRGFPRIGLPPKHKYVLAFDPAVQTIAESLSKPYPRNTRVGSIAGDAPALQVG